jgi:membrane protease YdiL (CAAX protease family)
MEAKPTSAGSRVTLPAAWRTWGAFVRSPVLPDRAEIGLVGGIRAIAPLLVLDLVIMAVLIGALSLSGRLGYQLPTHALDNMKLSPVLTALVVIAAPLVEDTAFRGWLSGRPGHLAGILVLAAGGALAALYRFALPGLIGLGAAVTVAGALLWLLRQRPPFAWFQRRFGWFYWGSALAFAALHLSNFAAAGPAALPLVLPQFVLALFLGYLRVTRGLWTSMALHMLHNGVFIGLILLGLG